MDYATHVQNHPFEVTANDSSQGLEISKNPGVANEPQVLPHNNIPVVCISLMMVVFLVALDETIVAMALPTIVAQLGGGNNYAWVNSAFLLAFVSSTPLYGKLADTLGRKIVFYPALFVFLLGSALCGAAQTMSWLIISRAIQGLGGSGMYQMVLVINADIFSLEDQGKYGGYIGATYGIASIIGPLIGGVLTDHVTWRWCFWINLPTGGVAAILLFFFLNLNPHPGQTFREHVRQFDFVGLFLLVSGTICVLLGFEESETACYYLTGNRGTISLLVLGLVILVIGGIYEGWTKLPPIIPPRLFKTRTTGLILIAVFLHSFSYIAAALYLPLYFQVLGASATRAGIQTIPFSFSISLVSVVAGYVVTMIGDYRPVIWFSWCVSCLGCGLMITLNETSSLPKQVLYLLIAGTGIGGMFELPIIALQAAMPVKDMATTIATMGLIRTFGSTIGVSVGQAIWTSELRRRAVSIPNFDLSIQSGVLVDSVRQIQYIQPESLRQQVLHAYSKSISTVWIVNTPLWGMGFIMVLFLKKYTLKREVIRSGEKGTQGDQKLDSGAVTLNDATSDVEKGIPIGKDSTVESDVVSGVEQDGESSSTAATSRGTIQA
ncbi:MFS amino acid permease [Gautieria morchelliformis]|nr:MFS amino acid permease [Gautieria morchelliformis]